MKHSLLILLLTAGLAASSAQTPAPPPATNPAPKTAATKATAKPKAAATSKAKAATEACAPVATSALPPGLPPVEGPVVTPFSLRYQEIQVGTGADAQPNKLYKVLYTGWRASDGV